MTATESPRRASESTASRPGRLAVSLAAMVAVVALAERITAATVGAPPGTFTSHRKPNVVTASKDPRVVPPGLDGRQLWLVGNSHTYTLPGLKAGDPLRDDPGSTLVDELEARVAERYPSAAQARFVRISNPNLLPTEMLVRVGYLMFKAGRAPEVLVLGVTWRNVARESGLRYEIDATLGDPAYAQWLTERVPAGGTLRDLLQAEIRKAQHAAAEEAARSDADRLDERLTERVSPHFSLMGESAELRARLYRAVAYRAQSSFGQRAREHVEPAVPEDLAVNAEALSALIQLAAAAGTRVIVYLAPERADLPPIVEATLEAGFDRRLTGLVEGHGGIVVDARDAVAPEYWGWEHDTPDRSHFTEPGHQALAKRLFDAADSHHALEALVAP